MSLRCRGLTLGFGVRVSGSGFGAGGVLRHKPVRLYRASHEAGAQFINGRVSPQLSPCIFQYFPKTSRQPTRAKQLRGNFR